MNNTFEKLWFVIPKNPIIKFSNKINNKVIHSNGNKYNLDKQKSLETDSLGFSFENLRIILG